MLPLTTTLTAIRIHGEAASALPWETPMVQETML